MKEISADSPITLVRYFGAADVSLATVVLREREGRVLTVMCLCPGSAAQNTHSRLGHGRCIICPYCNSLISRWGDRVTATGWVDQGNLSNFAKGVDNPLWS